MSLRMLTNKEQAWVILPYVIQVAEQLVNVGTISEGQSTTFQWLQLLYFDSADFCTLGEVKGINFWCGSTNMMKLHFI